ncbi:MAG TPA: long-chain fatty acid--CoA ligase [Thermoplasmata archaeon]|nr:long-chain fatty acid--CoA ligase [Thermoplasmata archaeon]
MSPAAGVEGDAGDRSWYAHYPPEVPHQVEVPNRRLPDVIEDSVVRHPQRTAFVFYGARTSYEEFWTEAGRFAAALQREGVGVGDRVAIHLPNCPLYPLAFFGALRLGATVVQVSPLYHGQDLTRVLEDARPRALVTLEILYAHVQELSPEVRPPLVYVARLREFYPLWKRPLVNLVLRRRGQSTKFPKGRDVRPWRTVRSGPRTFGAPPPGDPSRDTAVLQYTGGTTGRAKAAMLTHRNLVANALQCRAWFPGGSRDAQIVLAAIPFFHVYGMTVALNYPLVNGGTIVLQLRPDVPEILKLIDRYRPTEFPGVPALYQGINQNALTPKYRLDSIRACLSGSAPLPLEVARSFEKITGGRLVEGYGLTEASPVTHANPVEGERREGSIGLPFPSTDQRVVDLESGARVLGAGEVGELEVRGPQVMLGYYGQPEETAGVRHDGWLRTGDIARIDADGYAYIVDRKKDMIDVGGFNVYPREVEEVLFQHPKVLDVAVVGVPDERLGEVPHAVVVRKPGTDVAAVELIEFVRTRLAHYKAPRTVEFREVLPRNAVQKVLRRELRLTAAAALAATPSRPGVDDASPISS